MSVFPFSYSFSLSCILFHPSCVTLFLLPFHSISVLIIYPFKPVSYLTVSASIVTPNIFDFLLCLHHISRFLHLSVCLHLSRSVSKHVACGCSLSLARKLNSRADHVSINGCSRRVLLNVV